MLLERFRRSPAAAVSDEFHRAMTREVMRTERQRVKALMATVLLLLALIVLADVFLPGDVSRLFRGDVQLWMPFAIVVPFLIYGFGVLRILRWRMEHAADLWTPARYFGAFLETSLPSIALLVEIPRMGPSVALGFIGPMLYFLFIILSTLRLDFWLSTFTGVVAGAQLFAITFLHHDPTGPNGELMLTPTFQAARSLILVIGGVLAGAVGVRLRHQFEASLAAASARDYVTNLFGQHVSPQVVERLLDGGADLASDKHQVAVMFVDIRGFTAAARERRPEEVVERLDAAFAILVEIVDRNGGIVNKFLGDGFLALFGAPLHDPDAAARALAAGREMLEAMERDNEDHPWPLRIGIGLHLGDVVAGNVGSPRRKEYTVIGDTVNFASRLEALNKEFGSQLLVSDALREAAGAYAADAVSLGRVPIRGYEEPMGLWRLA